MTQETTIGEKRAFAHEVLTLDVLLVVVVGVFTVLAMLAVG